MKRPDSNSSSGSSNDGRGNLPRRLLASRDCLGTRMLRLTGRAVIPTDPAGREWPRMLAPTVLYRVALSHRTGSRRIALRGIELA